jgi:hypothetical protein
MMYMASQHNPQDEFYDGSGVHGSLGSVLVLAGS